MCIDFSIALGFIYDSKSYRNNSVILIQRRGFPPVITCITDNSSFYSQANGYSDWYDPSGRRVSDLDYLYYNYYATSQQCFAQYNHFFSILSGVNLVYTFEESYNTGSVNCSGLYHCLIPDRHGELQQLFLGIYNDISSIRKHWSYMHVCVSSYNNGEVIIFIFAASPTISSFYISQAPEYSLICISNNSAATEVTWKRNGDPITIDGIVVDSTQTVINTQHSIYDNKLIFLTSAVPPGLYTCMVTNNFGSATSDYGIISKLSNNQLIICYCMDIYRILFPM